jgi:hypothetical protein
MTGGLIVEDKRCSLRLSNLVPTQPYRRRHPMHLFKYAIASLALARGALAQSGGLLSVFAQSQTCDSGAITGIESGLGCGICYPLNQGSPCALWGTPKTHIGKHSVPICLPGKYRPKHLLGRVRGCKFDSKSQRIILMYLQSNCNSEIAQMQGGGCLGGSVSSVRIACPGGGVLL